MSMIDDIRPRIINVTRKPSKCPVCGENVVDIVYGTGDMTEMDFMLKYRKTAIMGGDDIPRRPPIWSCSCGCKRFRKVNLDGTDAPVKVKILKNIRKAPASMIEWTTESANIALENNEAYLIQLYSLDITTELGEQETICVNASNKSDAEQLAKKLVESDMVGLNGRRCVKVEIKG